MQTKVKSITIKAGSDSPESREVSIRTEKGELKSRMLARIIQSFRRNGELKRLKIPAILVEELIESREELKKSKRKSMRKSLEYSKRKESEIWELRRENIELRRQFATLEAKNHSLAELASQVVELPKHLQA